MASRFTTDEYRGWTARPRWLFPGTGARGIAKWMKLSLSRWLSACRWGWQVWYSCVVTRWWVPWLQTSDSVKNSVFQVVTRRPMRFRFRCLLSWKFSTVMLSLFTRWTIGYGAQRFPSFTLNSCLCWSMPSARIRIDETIIFDDECFSETSLSNSW